MNFKCACIIPCFNEEKQINYIFEEIKKLNYVNLDWYLLDNGSIDNTLKRMQELLITSETNNIYILSKKLNEGYGAGIKYAISKIFPYIKISTIRKNSNLNNAAINKEYLKENYYEFVAWTHADGQTPFEDIGKALELAQNNYDEKIFIKGQKTIREDGKISKFFEFALNCLLILFFNSSIKNPYSQPSLISKKLFSIFINKCSNDSLFDLDILIKSFRYKATLKRFNVRFLKRESGKGSNENIKQKVIFSLINLKLIWGYRSFLKFK